MTKSLFAPAQSSEVLLIDLANMAYRNAHAGKSMSTSDGTPSGHIYLTVKALSSLRRRYPYAELMFALDAPRKKTYRREMYPEYKAQRKSSLEYNPINDVQRLVSCMKCKIALADRYEADDVIAAIVAKQDMFRYIVISTDKDLWSLLQYQNVTILNPRETVGPKQFNKSFGDIPPYKIAMFKAILGDSSDNIPKVPRLRKKKVTELLKQSATLDDVFLKAEEHLSAKETEKLRNQEEMVRQNLKLATLQTTIAPEVLQNPGHPQLLEGLLTSYEISGMQAEMRTLLM